MDNSLGFKEEMRYNYDLNKDSLVFDVGGYQGRFASNIVEKYGCKVYVFEPVYHILSDDNIKVYHFGLSDSTRTEIINVRNDATSLYSIENPQYCYPVKLVSLHEFVKENKISKVDLIKINIEGEEYPLLRHMIFNDIVSIFKNIQVQYHDFIPNCRCMRETISDKLSETHIREWCYPFIWESWRKK